jgi:hypothetical protein
MCGIHSTSAAARFLEDFRNLWSIRQSQIRAISRIARRPDNLVGRDDRRALGAGQVKKGASRYLS